MTGAGEDEILRVVNVTAGYADRVVLRGVSFGLNAGGFLGLIGPNGSGKTTLLRVISGALPCRDGQVLLDGRGMQSLSRRMRSRSLAFVPQALDVPVAFTVRELVAMGRMPYVSGWAPLGARDVQAIRNALDMADAAGLEGRRVDELSAGERQRVVIALALAQEPRILLLDEPTAYLDIHHVWKLMELIHHLNRTQNLAVVVSLHDLSLAAEFCSELLLLEEGRAVALGAADDVMRADILSKVYNHPLDLVTLDDGRTVVVPCRSSKG